MKGSLKVAAILAIAAVVLFSCKKTDAGDAKTTGKDTDANVTIRVFGAFLGEDAVRFEEIVKVFNAKTGYNVVYEGSPEFETQILVQAEAGTPPDIAALPQPGMMKNFASRGFIKPLSADVVSKIDENYAKVWKDLG